jgi:hypothetical protein
MHIYFPKTGFDAEVDHLELLFVLPVIGYLPRCKHMILGCAV